MLSVTRMIGSSQYLRRAPRKRHICRTKSITFLPCSRRKRHQYILRKLSGAGPGGAPSFSLDSEGSANVEDGQGKTVAGKLPAVIVCHGSRAAGAWTSTGQQLANAAGDEQENADADLLFIQRPTGNDFDDLLVWVAPGVLKARLVSAGRLP